MEAALLKKWEVLANRYDELTNQLMDPSMMSQPSQLHKVNKERTDIEPAAKLLATYRDNARQLEEAAQILADPTAGPEFHKMATEESATLERQRAEIEQQAQELLIPKDRRDEKNLLLEIRAGTGGDEAALFAGALFRMYSKYAEIKGFKVDVVEATEMGVGGYKGVVALIEGKGAYSRFKFEAGVHRVQRVPVTEASGRIHTSTVTVAVMPEVDEVDIHIDPMDLRIVTFCSGQPSSSKWMWNGAIRKIRFPRSLKLPTCRITDTVSAMKITPATGSSRMNPVVSATVAVVVLVGDQEYPRRRRRQLDANFFDELEDRTVVVREMTLAPRFAGVDSIGSFKGVDHAAAVPVGN